MIGSIAMHLPAAGPDGVVPGWDPAGLMRTATCVLPGAAFRLFRHRARSDPEVARLLAADGVDASSGLGHER